MLYHQEKEHLEKKLVQAEREQKEKEAQNKSQSIMTRFFAKPKTSSQTKAAMHLDYRLQSQQYPVTVVRSVCQMTGTKLRSDWLARIHFEVTTCTFRTYHLQDFFFIITDSQLPIGIIGGTCISNCKFFGFESTFMIYPQVAVFLVF